MKFITFFCIVAALFFGVLANSYSSEYQHVYIGQSLSPTTTVNSKGIALAIATGQHNFDSSTFAWQGSISTGSYDDSTAFSFGLAKRFKSTLISGSVANEGGKIGYGASLGFHF